MSESDWATVADELGDVLHLHAPPIAITWTDEVPGGVERFDAPMPDPLPDGRTGRVSAPCVFWMHATSSTFATVEEDHGNCSVGLVTHGWRSLDEVAGNSDVSTLLETGWVTEEAAAAVPRVRERPEAMVYGPLDETPSDPDVVLVRVNARQLMVLSDALPDMRLEGKPQCHILAVAKEEREVAASVGCMLSRVRTDMGPGEMTCAIPGERVVEVVEALRATDGTDSAVARYAAEDARRFG